MKLKHFLLLAVFVTPARLADCVQAAPLVSIGDSVDVFFNGSSSLEWQSNVFSDERGAVDDFKLQCRLALRSMSVAACLM